MDGMNCRYRKGRYLATRLVLFMLAPWLMTQSGCFEAQAANTDMAADPRVKKAVAKLNELKNVNYGGDLHKMFSSFAGKDELLDQKELADLLDEAKVCILCGRWASKILAAFGSNGTLSWSAAQNLASLPLPAPASTAP